MRQAGITEGACARAFALRQIAFNLIGVDERGFLAGWGKQNSQ